MLKKYKIIGEKIQSLDDVKKIFNFIEISIKLDLTKASQITFQKYQEVSHLIEEQPVEGELLAKLDLAQKFVDKNSQPGKV